MMVVDEGLNVDVDLEVEKVGECWIDSGDGAAGGEVRVVVVDTPEGVLMAFLFPT